jgi:hypothetical protein
LITYKTPGTPGVRLIRLTDEEKKEGTQLVSTEMHSLYRTGTGMLLFLVKHSRPDIANAVRELTKLLDGPTQAAMKEMMRVIKFVIDTKHHGLRIEPDANCKDNLKWYFVMYADSEFAGDTQTRVSVGGHILFVIGVPLLWRSKAGKGVTLSSTEAEYVAMSEAAREVKFVVQLLLDLGFLVRLPVTIYCDNVGAIFLSGNATTSVRTRHISTRAHFVREMILDSYLTVKFCKSRDMVADGFSKNITGDLYDYHTPSYLLSSDDLNNNIDDPNTIGRVLEYMLDNEEARPTRKTHQTSLRTPESQSESQSSNTCKSSLGTESTYLGYEERRTCFRTETG